MLPDLGDQNVRHASRIGLSAAFARPRQPIAVDSQLDVGGPAFARVRALRNNLPAFFRLVFVLEDTERLPCPSPIGIYNGRQDALAKVARRAGTAIRCPNTHNRGSLHKVGVRTISVMLRSRIRRPDILRL